jgi:hypothetical protein
VSTPNRKFFTLNLEYDSFGFDFVMIHMLWLVNDFIEFGCYDMLCHVIIGRLVVVIDVNPSHGFWTTRLMKLFGHEGKCTCRYNTHGWIVYIMLFPVVCGTSRGSSWLRRNEFLKMTK